MSISGIEPETVELKVPNSTNWVTCSYIWYSYPESNWSFCLERATTWPLVYRSIYCDFAINADNMPYNVSSLPTVLQNSLQSQKYYFTHRSDSLFKPLLSPGIIYISLSAFWTYRLSHLFNSVSRSLRAIPLGIVGRVHLWTSPQLKLWRFSDTEISMSYFPATKNRGIPVSCIISAGVNFRSFYGIFLR